MYGKNLRKNHPMDDESLQRSPQKDKKEEELRLKLEEELRLELELEKDNEEELANKRKKIDKEIKNLQS